MSITVQGDYNKYECGLSVSKARAEDAGEWTCEFESYIKNGSVQSPWLTHLGRNTCSIHDNRVEKVWQFMFDVSEVAGELCGGDGVGSGEAGQDGGRAERSGRNNVGSHCNGAGHVASDGRVVRQRNMGGDEFHNLIL